jgi:hypothetical protein
MIQKLRWLMVVALLVGALTVSAQGDPIRQWATSAIATSEYGPDNWSAAQATGVADSKVCEDAVTAWASATVSMMDAITLFYDEAVYATQVNIYQNYNPGAITSVELIAADGSEIFEIPNSFDAGTPCPGVFTVDVELSKTAVFGVRIWLDQSLIGDWNEIDAVELVGLPANVATVDPSAIPPAVVVPDGSPAQGPSNPGNLTGGITVNCDNGVTFNNGVAVNVVQMRSGFNYTATAIGLNGFDPVLAVLGESGSGLCADDDVNAASYSALLPTTGQVQPSTVNSQVPFANTSNSTFADISLVVGGFNDQPGEFLLVLEGMTFSSADGAGDPFSVEITDGMVGSGVDVTAYAIAVSGRYDPTLTLIDGDYNPVSDDFGALVACDDAGNAALCWGDSAPLGNSYISRTGGRQLGGGPLDPMLSIPLSQDMTGGFLNFIVNGAQNTFGDYVMVFHMATQ